MPKGVHTSKRPSGCQQRQAKKARLQELNKISGALDKHFIKTDSTKILSNLNKDKQIEQIHRSENNCINYKKNESKGIEISENDESAGIVEIAQNNNNNYDNLKTSDIPNLHKEPENDKDKNSYNSVDILIFNDMSYWNLPLSDNDRVDLVLKGSHHFQNKEGPFECSTRPGTNPKGESRHLSKEWFYKKMPNDEKILRTWMAYSTITNKLYCFCCRLFSFTNTTSAFVKGFWKWWKLNPKVVEHETSDGHFQNFEKWKTLETGLRFNSTIDDANVQLMNVEKKKWKTLLVRLLDIILFLAKQNLPFRGHDESSASANKGNFLELVPLLSKYDAALKEHLLNLENSSQKISYLSPDIQNEFVSILSNHVKTKLIEDVKAAIYFGMMFDSTPDVSHTDQMSQVIRYVKICNRNVEIKEVFLGFFPADLSKEILNKLDNDGLDIMKCRSQGYDNAAVMSGIHGGVQAIIQTKNSFAKNASCIRFFGTLEAVYSFFSASTSRWEVLVNHSGITVKRVSTTQWSAHHDAVSVMAEKFNEISAAIEELCDPKENLDTRGAAQNLLPAIHNFSFLCYLFFWNDVLKEVNSTQASLQAKGLSLDKSLIKIEALRLYISEKRMNIVENAIKNAVQLCVDKDIPIERRVRRKKKMAREQARDEGLSLQEENKKEMLECLDRFHSEIQTRSNAAQDVAERFKVIQGNNLLLANEDDVKSFAANLSSFYDEVNGNELHFEILRLRRFLKATNIDLSTAKDWTAIEFLKFIVKFDFIQSLLNLVLSLKLFLTICVSVASCERSFSKMKLIKNYLRSTMSDSKLNNLAMLTIEYEETQNIDFDEVISTFASIKARKGKF